MIRIRRALISVSDKNGLAGMAGFLNRKGVELLSTGGTAKHLKEAGVDVTEVSDYTGSPEILDGRVKTLHPRIHGGLLGIRGKASHEQQMKEHGIGPIDMVIVNLYPFQAVASRAESSFEEVVEQIDIGGPSMVRSAAKNHASVAVVTDPLDYPWILKELEEHDCSLSGATRFLLAQKAFALTSTYDAAIARYLSERTPSADGVARLEGRLPALDVLALRKVQDLRYGENPHQRGALYELTSQGRTGVAAAEVLHGKELSYNNLLDGDAAWDLVLEFDRAACSVIKHNNPSGVAQSDTLKAAYVAARDCDPVSAFGSVVAFNRTVDPDTAAEVNTTFVEAVVAPDFDPSALEILRQKKNLRILRVQSHRANLLVHREIGGGFLVQDKDVFKIGRQDLKTVTRRAPTEDEIEAMLFGWRVVKHVKSNAIVFSDSSRTLGIGAGQMSRVDSVKWGAQRATLPLEGCAMASDAFFPFPDGLVAAAGYGVRAVIQPGGSVRDADVIEAADAHGIAMVFTGVRHFRH